MLSMSGTRKVSNIDPTAGCVFWGDAVGARANLDEAWEIADRGSMKLFLADINLHRARRFELRIAE